MYTRRLGWQLSVTKSMNYLRRLHRPTEDSGGSFILSLREYDAPDLILDVAGGRISGVETWWPEPPGSPIRFDDSEDLVAVVVVNRRAAKWIAVGQDFTTDRLEVGIDENGTFAGIRVDPSRADGVGLGDSGLWEIEQRARDFGVEARSDVELLVSEVRRLRAMVATTGADPTCDEPYLEGFAQLCGETAELNVEFDGLWGLRSDDGPGFQALYLVPWMGPLLRVGAAAPVLFVDYFHRIPTEDMYEGDTVVCIAEPHGDSGSIGIDDDSVITISIGDETFRFDVDGENMVMKS